MAKNIKKVVFTGKTVEGTSVNQQEVDTLKIIENGEEKVVFKNMTTKTQEFSGSYTFEPPYHVDLEGFAHLSHPFVFNKPVYIDSSNSIAKNAIVHFFFAPILASADKIEDDGFGNFTVRVNYRTNRQSKITMKVYGTIEYSIDELPIEHNLPPL